MVAVGGGLFGGLPPPDSFIQEMQVALCSAAFGARPFAPFGVNAINPADPVAPSTLRDQCFVSNDFVQMYLAPLGFGQSTSPANFVNLQQSRAFAFYRAAASACSSLFLLQQGFAAAAAAAPLFTPSALSPAGLAQAVETKWQSTLQAWAQQTTPLVPGSSPADILALDTMSLTFDFLRPLLAPPLTLPEDTYSFSSRLPFSRADFVYRGSQFFLPHCASRGCPQAFHTLRGHGRAVSRAHSHCQPWRVSVPSDSRGHSWLSLQLYEQV